MRNKKLIIAIVAIAAFIGFILIVKSIISKPKAKKGTPVAQTKKTLAKAPAKKVISKGKGGLTVRILNSKNAEIPMRIKAFKVIDKKSSVYTASSVGGRMLEVQPGTYDIEVETVPAKIFKDIKVAQGKETVENLGCVTGTLVIKTANSKKVATSYPMRILEPRTGDMVTAYMTNRAIDIVPGVYDIEIGTSPRQYKNNMKVEAGKEVVADLGCLTGSLLVKTVDEERKDIRCTVRVMRSDTNEIVNSGTSNKPVELGKGTYNIEILTYPKQSKKDIKINVGEDTVAEFIVKTQPVVQKPAASAPRKAAAKPRP